MSPYRNDSNRLSEPTMRNPNMSLSSTSTQSDGRASSDSCNIKDSTSTSVRRIKCVLVGDAGVGKTSLIVSYTTNGYPQEYVPTAFDNYSVLVRVDNQPVQLQLCDTAGQADFDHLRPLCYPNTDVFIVCFSVVNPTSFYNLQQRWIPELKQNCPSVPCILVGTQSDQRTNVNTILKLSQYGETVITETESVEYAKEVKALKYIECSALTQHNMKEVFDSVILASMQIPVGVDRSKVSLEKCGGRKSFKKLKDKLKRSNSIDSTKHSSLQVRRQASNQRLNLVGLSPEKQSSNNKYSTRSAPTSALYGSSAVLSTKATPEKKQQNSPSKLKKGWRRLLCMA